MGQFSSRECIFQQSDHGHFSELWFSAKVCIFVKEILYKYCHYRTYIIFLALTQIDYFYKTFCAKKYKICTILYGISIQLNSRCRRKIQHRILCTLMYGYAIHGIVWTAHTLMYGLAIRMASHTCPRL